MGNNKIGLGLITCNSPEKIRQSAVSVSHVDEFVIVNDGKPYSSDCYPPGAFVIQHQENMKVARSKNDALHYLMDKGCEHIFLMEDDVIIKDPQVFLRYIRASSRSGIKHLNYALQGPFNFKPQNTDRQGSGLMSRTFDERNAEPAPLLVTKYNQEDSISFYPACVGAFSYFHRSVIEKSGYFNEQFRNSWEHIEHTYRIIRDEFHPPFGWFADIKDSCLYLQNIDNCMEQSTIAKDPEWKSASDKGEEYFKKTYGHGPTKIPKTGRNQVLKSLTKIYESRDFQLLIKFPTRGRREKFFQVLDTYLDMMEDKQNYSIVVSCDQDDADMCNPEVKSRLDQYKNLRVHFGNNKTKIEAVNADLSPDEDFDIILLASDDMIPVVKGYDRIIREMMKKKFPDTDGVLFFNDGYQGDKLNTLCILGRAYYKRFNYIYHPAYKSLWCDNEFMHVADMLGKQTYFEQNIIRHEHPDSNRSLEEDQLYEKNQKFNSSDRITYEGRKKNNFDLSKVNLFLQKLSPKKENQGFSYNTPE